MLLVCTCSRHKLCLACYRAVDCVSQFLACHFCCIYGLLYSVAGCHVHFIICICSSCLIPFLHLPCLPSLTSQATRSFVGGHCMAFSCIGVLYSSAASRPACGLKCGHGHRHTITGSVKISHLSCQRSPAFRVVAAQQKKYIFENACVHACTSMRFFFAPKLCT